MSLLLVLKCIALLNVGMCLIGIAALPFSARARRHNDKIPAHFWALCVMQCLLVGLPSVYIVVMSRIKLKLHRRFATIAPPEGKIGPSEPVRRDQPLPAAALVNIGPCAVCLNPLMVAVGQRIRFHKECRKAGRKRFGRSGGVINEKGEWVAPG